jgi:hypothetical protein
MPRHNGNTTKASKRQARIDRARFGTTNDPEEWERYTRQMMRDYPEDYSPSWTSETAQEGRYMGD